MKIIKLSLLVLLLLCLSGAGLIYAFLWASLPTLDGEVYSPHLSGNASLKRDTIGMAVIEADTQDDAAFLLGYAHAQDRLFQMDLLRKNAAGELSEIVGAIALEKDKEARFFQFREKAAAIAEALPPEQKRLIQQYAKGVNQFIDNQRSRTFEFVLNGYEMAPWQVEDTILATFSMYIDLQGMQVERDFENTAIEKLFGQPMLDFLYQSSPYQAAIDLSNTESSQVDIPYLPEIDPAQKAVNGADTLSSRYSLETDFTQDIGSNNWAVSGALSDSQSALLSSDMHLGLQVPIIWYRAQMNYTQEGERISVSGVSLPGTPLIIAGSNGYIAWGFTNSNVDNVDWVRLEKDAKVYSLIENIKIKNEKSVEYEILMSDYGPVRELMGERYALRWVALMPYAVNMDAAQIPKQKTTEDALNASKTLAIPVQNMVLADAKGNIAWQLIGAITARSTPSLSAIEQSEYDEAWERQDTNPAFVLNPQNQRVWSANARVISTKDLPRYGDGGYALGARQRQIVDALLEQDNFDESSFNKLQLDNRALFLNPWHNLLKQHLSKQPQKFAPDIVLLDNWQACACSDSVGYTLVRYFRSAVINTLFEPIKHQLAAHDIPLRQSLRKVEAGIWQILNERPEQWLPKEYDDYSQFLIASYENSKQSLIEKHDADPQSLAGLEWGKVNTLTITHPFASSLGPLGRFLNMEEVEGFGDSYMPAVQGRSFGASQRLIVRPGNLDKAVLTVPGGQSMHPLSPYFDAGFAEYAQGELSPLLPRQIQHELRFTHE